ncbi:MAG: putative Ig domain-containing protein [Gammaproteobacteria bacterium]|nr:putative Ig domain-containing protein [Gammaproteobacteria bacterium]
MRYLPDFSSLFPTAYLPSIPPSLSNAVFTFGTAALANAARNPFASSTSALLPVLSGMACLPMVTANTQPPASLDLADLSTETLENHNNTRRVASALAASPDPETPAFLTTLDTAAVAYSVQQTQDSGFIVAGYTNSLGAGNYDLMLTKFTPEGTLSWTKTLGGVNDDQGFSIQETNDAGFIVTGQTSSFGIGPYNTLLGKFSSNGTLQWAKTAGGADNDVGLGVRQMQDGGFIVAGYTSSFGAGGYDVLLTKFFPNGTLSWAKTLGGGSNEQAYSIQLTQDAGFIVSGYTYSFGGGFSDVLLAKFSASGALLWAKTLGGSAVEIGYDAQQTQDGGFIVGGHNSGFGTGTGTDNGLLAKFSSNGILLWAKVLTAGDHTSFDSVQQIQDGGFIVTGASDRLAAGGKSETLVAKFSSNGTLLWAVTLASNYSNNAHSIQQTSDGGFAITGEGSAGLFLAKFDPNSKILNCNMTQVINLAVRDVTNSINVTSPAFTVTTPNISVLNWPIAAVSQNLTQNRLCSQKSETASDSLIQSGSLSHSLGNTNSKKQTDSHSFKNSDSKKLSNSHSLKNTDSRKLSNSHSLKNTDSKKLSNSHSSEDTNSQKSTDSLSAQIVKTLTPQPTPTRATRLSTSALIQASDLSITGIIHAQISPSGALVLIQTSAGLQLITVSQNSVMTEAGQLALPGIIKATVFSQDEHYLFVANNQNSIQIINLNDPTNPISIGFVSAGTGIQSLSMSGGGQHLLVGTNAGITVLSAATPAMPTTMTMLTTYRTSEPVKSIQANPNNNVVAIGSGNNVTLLKFENNNFTALDQKIFTSPIRSISPVDQVAPTQLTLTLNNGDTVFLNTSNPKSATVVSIIPGSSSELTTVSGTTLLAAGVKPGIQIFQNDRKNWQTAREAGYSPVTGSVTNLLFSADGGFAIYTDNQGLKLIKVIKDQGRLDVPLPRLLNTVKLGFPVRNVLLNEERGWIAVGGNQLTFIARENLQLPTILGVFNTTGNVQQMMLFPDKTKLLLIDEAGIACIDCFSPTLPRLLGRWNSATTIYGATLSGSHVYVCQGAAGISVLDISNPLNIIKTSTLTTQAAAQSIQFNRDHSLAFVADSAGIEIWSIQTPLTFQRISRFNAAGFVSNVMLSPDEQMLYFVNEQVFAQINISDSSTPILSRRLDASRPIKNILLSNQGTVAYLADETAGMLIVNTESMQIQSQLVGTDVNAMALTECEDKIYVADGEGGLKIAELITELPIIPLTSRTHYPVGIRVEVTLLFFNQTLNPVAIDRINSIQYINYGQKQDLPLWISADLIQGKLFVTAPKELTDQVMQLAISLDVDGIRQDTLYQTQISSSLLISSDRGVVTITTPSPTVSVRVNLTQGSFIPQSPGALSVSAEDNILQAYGPVADINRYLQSVRINPNPITLNQSAVALNSAQIEATDIINLSPSNAIARLRNFHFNQPPVLMRPMNRTNKKALDPFSIIVPPNTFADPDDSQLMLSAQFSNASWLTFNPVTATFSGEAPVWMLNKSLQIRITATDGYLSANSIWELHIDANNGPFAAKSISSATRTSGAEFSWVLPTNTFQDDDNNTLTYSAVQDDYDVLPSFLNFNPKTQTLLGRPTSGDVNNYAIKLTATDKFGASAEAILDLTITFSNWDLFLYALNILGYITIGVAPLTWAYYSRSFIYNTVRREHYWRNEIPENLLEGRGYKPRNPKTEAEIKDDIVKIHVMTLNAKKFGHDFAKNKLPIHWYIHFFAKALLNDEPLPTWLVFDRDAGTLTFKPEHFISDNNSYVYQTIGKASFIGNVILESFFINLATISMYEAPKITALPSHESTPNATGLSSSLELTPNAFLSKNSQANTPDLIDHDDLTGAAELEIELEELATHAVNAAEPIATSPQPTEENLQAVAAQEQTSISIESTSSDDDDNPFRHENSAKQYGFFYGQWVPEKKAKKEKPLEEDPQFEL